MDIFLKNKKTVVAIVVVVLLFFFYSVFFSPDSSTPEGVASQRAATVESEGLIKTADELSNITFKQDLFASPAYKLLVDFSTELQSQPTGRPNPFGEIGRD